MMDRRAFLVLLLLSGGCTSKQDLPGGWRVTRPARLFSEGAGPTWELHRRIDGDWVEVDRLILTWRLYGSCVVYATSRDVNSYYVACGDRAPCLVGVSWEFTEDGLVQAGETEGGLLRLPARTFTDLTAARPLLTPHWYERDTERERTRMLEHVERVVR